MRIVIFIFVIITLYSIMYTIYIYSVGSSGGGQFVPFSRRYWYKGALQRMINNKKAMNLKYIITIIYFVLLHLCTNTSLPCYSYNIICI